MAANFFQTAERVLAQSCGQNMNTWIVASHPIGHYAEEPAGKEEADDATTQEQLSRSQIAAEKTFFMKARIFAGQADLHKNTFGLEEFKWLTKEEAEKHVTPEYWASIKNILVEQ